MQAAGTGEIRSALQAPERGLFGELLRFARFYPVGTAAFSCC